MLIWLSLVAGTWFAEGKVLWKADDLCCVYCNAMRLLKDVQFLASPVPHMVVLGSSWFPTSNDNFPVVEPELSWAFFFFLSGNCIEFILLWAFGILQPCTHLSLVSLHVLFLIAPASSLLLLYSTVPTARQHNTKSR